MMSKILMNITLFHTKLIVNTYTALSLPFYAIYQKPWQRLKISNQIYSQMISKTSDSVVWTRNGPPGTKPITQCSTYLEAFKFMDRSRPSIGVREILDEKISFDEEGLPITIDGKILKKIVLDDKYKWMTIGEVLDQIDVIAKGLHDIGVRKGDNVVIYADTSPNWFFTSMALAKLSAITVTLFANLGDSGVIYGINQTKAKHVITSEELKEKMLTYIDRLSDVQHIIYYPRPKNAPPIPRIDEIEMPENLKITSFDDMTDKGAKMPPIEFKLPEPDDLVLIMYTSGTTSLPKAVMINHRMLLSSINSVTTYFEHLDVNVEDLTMASFLPLSHIYGYVFNILLFINGTKIGFATPFTLLNSSPAHVPGQTGDLRLIQPDFFVVVPLILERFQKEIYAQLNRRGFLASPLFTYFMEYKNRWLARGFRTPIIDRIICEKIKEQFGGKIDIIGVGGAALHTSIEKFTRAALDVEITNGFGCTETCGGVYVKSPKDLTLGTVGTPCDKVFGKLIDWPEGGYTTQDKPNQRGEIVIGGDMVAVGYFGMPEETKESFYRDENGIQWFYTGDIGEINPKTGQLKIIDRKKDLAKLANGEYVSLGKIETGLRSSRYVENICICTEMFSNDLVALITPNRKIVKELAKSLNKSQLSHPERCQDEEIITIVHASIKETGQRAGLKSKEIPTRINLCSEEWTPDNNLLTAAFKLKRKNVYQYYEKEIRQMFNSMTNK